MSNRKIDIIKTYFSGLEEGSFEKIIKLFNKGAIVYSPLYGPTNAIKFYKELFEDTNNSKITLKNVFLSSTNSNTSAAHFFYEWEMKDNQKLSFECIKVFEFSSNNEIISLKIIYDTFPIRKEIENIRS